MKYYLKEPDDNYTEFEVSQTENTLEISQTDKTYSVDIVKLAGMRYSVIINNQSLVVEAKTEKDAVDMVIEQQLEHFVVQNPTQKIQSEIFGDAEDDNAQGEVHAPMPGIVLRFEVEKGQTVTVGQPLLVIEAMKMENEIRSLVNGTVLDIFTQAQTAVEKDDLLIKIGDPTA